MWPGPDSRLMHWVWGQWFERGGMLWRVFSSIPCYHLEAESTHGLVHAEGRQLDPSCVYSAIVPGPLHALVARGVAAHTQTPNKYLIAGGRVSHLPDRARGCRHLTWHQWSNKNTSLPSTWPGLNSRLMHWAWSISWVLMAVAWEGRDDLESVPP